jgi:hypothetical protein
MSIRAAVCLMMLLPSCSSPAVITSATGAQFTVGGVANGEARVALEIDHARTDLWFANVAADLNGDGSFANYTSSAGAQPEWVVQNLPVNVFPGELGLFFEIVDPGLSTAKPIRVRAILTADVVAATGTWDGTFPSSGVSFEGTLGFTTKEAPEIDQGSTDTQSGGGGDRCQLDGNGLCAADTPPPPPPPEHVGDDQGNKLRPMSQQPPGTHDCVIRSIASSLVYLTRKAKQTMLLGDNVSFNNLSSHPDVLTDIESQIKQSFTDCGAYTGTGVPNDKLATAKATFVSDKHLAVTTSRTPSAGTDGSGAWDALLQGLRNGCAVEVGMGLYLNGVLQFGHMVAVDGATLTATGASITFRDPLDGDVKPNIVHTRVKAVSFPTGGPPTVVDYRHGKVAAQSGRIADFPLDAQIEYVIVECSGQPTAPTTCDGGTDGGGDAGSSGGMCHEGGYIWPCGFVDHVCPGNASNCPDPTCCSGICSFDVQCPYMQADLCFGCQ